MFKKDNIQVLSKWQSLLFVFIFLFMFIIAIPNVFAASLAYVGDFTEVAVNDGSVGVSRVITLTGDTFVDPITLSTHLNVTNVPAGLTAVVTRDSAIQITVTLTGNATSHVDADDIADLTITFLDGAFVIEGTASNVTGYINISGEIDFNDQAFLEYKTGFTEVLANDGSVLGERVIDIIGDTFVNGGGNLIENTHFTLTNKPEGFVVLVLVTGVGTKACLILTGNADNHIDVNDVADLTITFLDGAFTNTITASDVTDYSDATGTIDFTDQAFLSYSSDITETLANDGSVTGSEIITLTDDTFVDPIILTTHLNVTNVPAGLTAVITRDSTTQLSLTLTGNADDHVDADDVADLTITFLDGAFTNTTIASNVDNYIDVNGTVDFNDQALLSYNSHFTEVQANDGSVEGPYIITLSGDTFVNPITLNTHLTVINVPTGLTAVATRDSSTQITITLIGNAENHLDIDDVTNLIITFLDAAFTNTTLVTNVDNYGDTVVVDFNNTPLVPPLPVFSAGLGSFDSKVGMEKESNMTIIDEDSANFLLCINSVINFQIEGDSSEFYTAKIKYLNTTSGLIKILFSNGQVLDLFVDELGSVDLNGDSISDIFVNYNNLKINIIDLTLTKIVTQTEVSEDMEYEESYQGAYEEEGVVEGIYQMKSFDPFSDYLLLKGYGYTTVYLLHNNKIRPIPNETVFYSYGFSWDEITEKENLDDYQIGRNLTLTCGKHKGFINGDLLKEKGNSNVYILENGKKRHIVSEEIFNLNGFHWDEIYELDDLSIYSVGETLGSVLEEENNIISSAFFDKDLQIFMQNDDVKRLQVILARDPNIYPEAIISGYFGNLTKAAVLRFQIRHGIIQYAGAAGAGRVGPLTRVKLRKLFRK